MSNPGTVPAREAARRRLLRFLLQSPLLAAPGLLGPVRALARPEFAVPGSLDEVLDVFQMQRVAQTKLDPEAWHFIVNGADDSARWRPTARPSMTGRCACAGWWTSAGSTRASRSWARNFPRRSCSRPPVASRPSTPTASWPPCVAPSERGHLMIVSTTSSSSVGEIRAAGASPLWFQLYPSPDQGLMRHLLAGAEAAGCLAVA